ncbi:MAG: DUF99 family protein [Deltaproteobacteria bacterium]|nr:DUF99 family protein [Deltaproteobacteria bacterium]MBW2418789.1 DUF99 family protein [Deltaproteobacteria bacterium]
MTRRPHVIGIDDGPFSKGQSDPVPVVAVMMEGADLTEGVAIHSMEVDGADATDFIVDWISGLRFHASTQALMLGGITIGGLGIVDIAAVAARLERPVLVVNRKDPGRSQLREALHAAGLPERLEILERTPPAARIDEGLYLAAAGVEPEAARRLLQATLHKARWPEPLRLAHLIARALVRGESRGRA